VNTEKVPNTPLSGTELKELLKLDFQKMLDNDGLLSSHIAYGRVSYRISLIQTVGHATNPHEDVTSIESRALKGTAIENHPMADPPADAVATTRTRHRVIDSPNAERVRAGLPIEVEAKDQDGSIRREKKVYPPQPDLGEGQVEDEVVTGD
jgi:hypothetical protein